jgi:hypothetical protein
MAGIQNILSPRVEDKTPCHPLDGLPIGMHLINIIFLPFLDGAVIVFTIKSAPPSLVFGVKDELSAISNKHYYVWPQDMRIAGAAWCVYFYLLRLAQPDRSIIRFIEKELRTAGIVNA